MWRDVEHRALDIVYPAIRAASGHVGIVSGYDLLLYEVVDRHRIELILQMLIDVGRLCRECPAGTLLVPFVPPAVQHGEIEDSVHLCLFARSTRGLHEARRVVEPYIDAWDKRLGKRYVVVG